MDNFELMRILQKLNLSNRNKNLALYFGALATVGFFFAYKWHKKYRATQDDNLSLFAQVQTLMQQRDKCTAWARQQNIQNLRTNNVKKNYAENSICLVKKS